jgi:peptidoglycan/LPS O-acetylase OafA/YrhL
MLARLSRILPLYYAALLSAVVIEWLIAGDRPSCWPHGLNRRGLLAQLFVVQNLVETYGSFAPSWSITNEMFYYAFYAAVVCAALRLGLRPTSLGISICIVLALVLDWLYFFEYRNGYVRSPGLLFGLGIIWFCGAMVAEHREWLQTSQAARRASAVWPAVLILAMAIWYSRRVHLQTVYLVTGMAFTLMLMRFVVTEPNEKQPDVGGRARALIRLFGLASYPTYLFHGPIVMLAATMMVRCSLACDWRLTWVILTSVGVGTGLLLGRVVEAPMMAWRAGLLNRFRDSRIGSARGASVSVLGMQQ